MWICSRRSRLWQRDSVWPRATPAPPETGRREKWDSALGVVVSQCHLVLSDSASCPAVLWLHKLLFSRLLVFSHFAANVLLSACKIIIRYILSHFCRFNFVPMHLLRLIFFIRFFFIFNSHCVKMFDPFSVFLLLALCYVVVFVSPCSHAADELIKAKSTQSQIFLLSL